MKARSTRTSQISEAQLAANRANAELSTGPRTNIGKRIASLNAVKTGLTGRTVLLPSDDAVAYQQHVESFFEHHKPQSDREYEVVQSLADTQWRLQRIPALEMAIFARGRVQSAAQFPEYDAQTAAMLVDAETAIAYERQLRNLWVQERRLRRQYEDDLDALRTLMHKRSFDHLAKAKPAPLHVAKPQILPSIGPSNGFEFSTAATAEHLLLKKLQESGKRINKLSLEEMEKEIDSLDALTSLLPDQDEAA
jgi:hypothetical protein